MKRLFAATFVLLILGGLVAADALPPVQLTLNAESRLWVEGTSTVHDWTCEVGAFAGILDVSFDAQTLEALTGAEVTVPVTQLDCKNGTMDRKAYRALKSDEHPLIRYALGRATVQPGAEAGHLRLETTGTLTLAGAQQTVDFAADGEPLGDGRYRFTGRLPLRMSDFGVDPPKAMLGALRTGDEVVVHFDVVAEAPSS